LEVGGEACADEGWRTGNFVPLRLEVGGQEERRTREDDGWGMMDQIAQARLKL